ncbi:MAG: glycosyltransferase [Bacteroidales bacterium]|nr:glycosyltransferase [Bacteroidales bacterium]
MNSPKVSVIIPVYNASPYIVACIDSVIFQTMDDIEVLIVDDKGNDDAMSKSARYVGDYRGSKLFRFLEMPSNGGPGKARNLALETAQGEYVAFLDSDDILEAGFCELMYSAARRQKADIVGCDLMRETVGVGESKTEKGLRAGNGEFAVSRKKRYLVRENADFHTFIYNRQFLLENEIKFPETRSAEDKCFLACSVLQARRVATVKRPLYHYRVRRTSSSQEKDALRFRHRTASFDALMDYAKSHSLHEDFSQELDYLYLKEAFLVSCRTYVANTDEYQSYVLEEMFLNFRSKFPEYRQNRYYRRDLRSRFTLFLLRTSPKAGARYIRNKVQKIGNRV